MDVPRRRDGRGHRSRAVLGLAAALLVLAGVACSGSEDSAEGGAADAPAATQLDTGDGGDAGAEAMDAEADDGATGDAAGIPAGADLGTESPPTEAERIVYTAELRVRVEDPAATAARAIDLVEGAGGSVASQSEVDGEDLVTLTVRVPVDGFRSALDALGELGTVLDRRVDAEEVTDQIVDLEGRLENARASADRLRALYATAEDVAQVVAIEQALTQREAEVESLAGQLQQLEDRADRSTITAVFVDEGEPVGDEPEDDDSAFVDGLQAGRDVLAALGTGIAALVGFALPFLPLVVVPLLAVVVAVRLRRRRARRGATPANEAGSEPDPTSGSEASGGGDAP